VLLAHSCLTEVIRLANILVTQEWEALKVLAHCIRLEAGNLAAGRKVPVLDALHELAWNMAEAGSLVDNLAVVEDSQVVVVEGSLAADRMAVVEDNRQAGRHTAAGHKELVEGRRSPEAGPGRMEVADDS
jgi:hypothetical protein